MIELLDRNLQTLNEIRIGHRKRLPTRTPRPFSRRWLKIASRNSLSSTPAPYATRSGVNAPSTGNVATGRLFGVLLGQAGARRHGATCAAVGRVPEVPVGVVRAVRAYPAIGGSAPTLPP